MTVEELASLVNGRFDRIEENQEKIFDMFRENETACRMRHSGIDVALATIRSEAEADARAAGRAAARGSMVAGVLGVIAAFMGVGVALYELAR